MTISSWDHGKVFFYVFDVNDDVYSFTGITYEIENLVKPLISLWQKSSKHFRCMNTYIICGSSKKQNEKLLRSEVKKGQNWSSNLVSCSRRLTKQKPCEWQRIRHMTFPLTMYAVVECGMHTMFDMNIFHNVVTLQLFSYFPLFCNSANFWAFTLG